MRCSKQGGPGGVPFQNAHLIWTKMLVQMHRQRQTVEEMTFPIQTHLNFWRHSILQKCDPQIYLLLHKEWPKLISFCLFSPGPSLVPYEGSHFFRYTLAQEKLLLTHYTVLQKVSSLFYTAIPCYTTKSPSNNQTLNPSLLEFHTFRLASVPIFVTFSNPYFWHVFALLKSLLGFHTI